MTKKSDPNHTSHYMRTDFADFIISYIVRVEELVAA